MNRLKDPPFVLVKTWYDLLTQTECKEASSRAKKMLIATFGSEQAVAEYLKENNIIK